jgi:hypothetical protein
VNRLAFAALLFVAAPAFADTPEPPKPPPCPAEGCKAQTAPAPTVELPATKAVAVGERFSIAPVVTAGGTPRIWLPDKGLTEDRTYVDLLPQDVRDRLSGWVFYAQSPGVYRIGAYCGGANNTCSPIAVCTVTVGDVPAPGPGPTPGPNPPSPDPFGGTAPGLKVLFVVETSDTSKLPRWQAAIATSPVLTAYLNSHCMDAPDGKTKAWRVWDQNVDPSAEAPLWQKAWKAKGTAPWLLVGNGTGGYSGPLPATVDETLKLLKQYGGN